MKKMLKENRVDDSCDKHGKSIDITFPHIVRVVFVFCVLDQEPKIRIDKYNRYAHSRTSTMKVHHQ